MLEIPMNERIPKNKEERDRQDFLDDMDLEYFRARSKLEMAYLKTYAVEPLVHGIFPISQKESEFSELPYGKVGTIGEAGCGPLALEYALRANGIQVDFKELVKEIARKGYRAYMYNKEGAIIDGCGTEYSLFDNFGYRLSCVSQVVRELKNKSMICTLVQNSIYRRNINAKGRHFVNLIGIDKAQNAIIMDGNLIWDERYPKEAINKIPVKEFLSGIRAAWAWDFMKMKRMDNFGVEERWEGLWNK